MGKPGITPTPGICVYVSKPRGGFVLIYQYILFSYHCYRLAI